MAIDRFREGMSLYLEAVEKKRREIAAGELNEIARRLLEQADSEEIKAETLATTGKLVKDTTLIKALSDEIKEFTTKMAGKFSRAGIELPPVEILTQPISVNEAYKRKEAIRSNLGNPGSFLVPALEEGIDPLEQHVKVLDLPRRPYNWLIRSGRSTIGNILGSNISDLNDIRNFGSGCVNSTVDALDRFGVVVISPLPSESPLDASVLSGVNSNGKILPQ